MSSILSAFYNNTLSLSISAYNGSDEYRQAQEKVLRLHDALCSRLDKEQWRCLDALLDAEGELSSCAVEDAYIRGMRMGAQLTAALLGMNDERA